MNKTKIKNEILETFSPRGYLRTHKLFEFQFDQHLTPKEHHTWPIELLDEVVDEVLIEA